MSDQENSKITLDSAILEQASGLLSSEITEHAAPEDQRDFLEGLQLLQAGEFDEATRAFRKAAKEAPAPFNTLSAVARAECERLQGHDDLAVHHWREVAEDEDSPSAAKYIAWLNLAVIAENESDEDLLERAKDAVEDLEEVVADSIVERAAPHSPDLDDDDE